MSVTKLQRVNVLIIDFIGRKRKPCFHGSSQMRAKGFPKTSESYYSNNEREKDGCIKTQKRPKIVLGEEENEWGDIILERQTGSLNTV